MEPLQEEYALLNAKPPLEPHAHFVLSTDWVIKLRSLGLCSRHLTPELSPQPLPYLSARTAFSFWLCPALLDPYIGLSPLLCLLMNPIHESARASQHTHLSSRRVWPVQCALPAPWFCHLSPSPRTFTRLIQWPIAHASWELGVFFWRILFHFPWVILEDIPGMAGVLFFLLSFF